MQNVYEEVRNDIQIISVFNDANDAWLKIYQNIESADSDAKYVFRSNDHYTVEVDVGAMIGEYYDAESFIDDAGMTDSHDIEKVRELFAIFEEEYGIGGY